MDKMEFVLLAETQGEQWGHNAVPLMEDKLRMQNHTEGPAEATGCCSRLSLLVDQDMTVGIQVEGSRCNLEPQRIHLGGGQQPHRTDGRQTREA